VEANSYARYKTEVNSSLLRYTKTYYILHIPTPSGEAPERSPRDRWAQTVVIGYRRRTDHLVADCWEIWLEKLAGRKSTIASAPVR
jgi:hypothetical protein